MPSLTLDSPELAEEYDIAGVRQLEYGKILVADLKIGEGHLVLDVGCGTGLLGAYVSELVGTTGKVVGVDPLTLRVERANRKAVPRFTAQVGHAEDLSAFADQSFDVVYLSSVFHWLPDQARALREIRRVLKPGGRLGFTTGDKAHPHAAEVVRRRALQTAGLNDHASATVTVRNTVSVEDIRALFRETRYRERQILSRTFLDRFGSAREVLSFMRASSFGNHFAKLSSHQLERVLSALEQELALYRDGDVFRLQRYLLYALADRDDF
jgi:ubiquinone/menaquinone biosynthesis C-methylase UbiE